MGRTCVRISLCMVLLLSAAGAIAVADGVDFSGSVGLDITYTPVPPTSYNIDTGLSMAFSVSGFTFTSTTGVDLTGFQSEIVTLDVDLGAVQLGDEIRFEPTFSWNALSMDLSIVGVNIGVDLILADIGTPQTPTYSVGGVLSLSSDIVCGLSLTSLTGFGAEDLVNMLGGIEAPFSAELLSLFDHVNGLCVAPASLDVSIEPGFYFEEELFRVEVDTMGMIASSTTWFQETGLTKLLFEIGYRFCDPHLALLASMSLDGGFNITEAGFILDLQIENVRFTSHTAFTQLAPLTIIPIVFDSQAFAVSFSLGDVQITSTTTFDASFFFAQQQVAVEATIDPVTFTSLTTFDATGFVGQCIYADVQFCGVTLYTRAKFDFTGVQLVTVGFDLRFGN